MTHLFGPEWIAAMLFLAHHLFETVLQKAILDALSAPSILPLSKTSLPFYPSDADKKIVRPQFRLLMENTVDPAAFQDSTYGA